MQETLCDLLPPPAVLKDWPLVCMISACQLTLPAHFFFASEPFFRHFAANVSAALRDRGFFYGTGASGPVRAPVKPLLTDTHRYLHLLACFELVFARLACSPHPERRGPAGRQGDLGCCTPDSRWSRCSPIPGLVPVGVPAHPPPLCRRAARGPCARKWGRTKRHGLLQDSRGGGDGRGGGGGKRGVFRD
jgi:hypothetical protein